jgi:hypothetical protein
MVKHEDLFHASPDLCYRVCSEKQVAADIRYPRFMKRKDPGYLLINNRSAKGHKTGHLF